MVGLFVWNEDFTRHIPVVVLPAVKSDLENTAGWQTQWTTKAVEAMPNKVALHRKDTGELLGLMSYQLDHQGLAVEIIYVESAGHSNANLTAQIGRKKRYIGIAKALFAYAVQVSLEAGFGGVLFFRAKTSELREYYKREFGAVQLGQYDPFRMIIWEDVAEAILTEYREEAE